MERLTNVLKKLKDKKTWGPLVGAAALGFTAYTGTPVSEGMQEETVGAIVEVFQSAEGLLVAGAAALGIAGLWNAGQNSKS